MITKGECVLSNDEKEILRKFTGEKLRESLEKAIKTNIGDMFDGTGVVNKKWTNES